MKYQIGDKVEYSGEVCEIVKYQINSRGIPEYLIEYSKGWYLTSERLHRFKNEGINTENLTIGKNYFLVPQYALKDIKEPEELTPIMQKNKMTAEEFIKQYYQIPNNDYSRIMDITAGDITELMQDYAKIKMIHMVSCLKDFANESQAILGHDVRTAEEFVEIFLKKF